MRSDVQVVILCGGRGTRIRDVSENVIPKAMVPIGDFPMVWHIMKQYACQGHTDFVLCLEASTDEMRPDEAGPAGYEDTHAPSPLSQVANSQIPSSRLV